MIKQILAAKKLPPVEFEWVTSGLAIQYPATQPLRLVVIRRLYELTLINVDLPPIEGEPMGYGLYKGFKNLRFTSHDWMAEWKSVGLTLQRLLGQIPLKKTNLMILVCFGADIANFVYCGKTQLIWLTT